MTEKVLEKNTRVSAIMNRETSFVEICNMLDEEQKRYESWEMQTYTLEQVWESFINRKNTFLTSK